MLLWRGHGGTYLIEAAFFREHLEAPAVGFRVSPGVFEEVEILAAFPPAELPQLLSGCHPQPLGGRVVMIRR